MTNSNENLVRDIINPQEQLIAYTGSKVGFYDGLKAGEPALYIYIKGNGDRFTEVRRRAGKRKVKDPITHEAIEVEETKLFARAYEKYLQIKNNGGIADPEKAAMAARIAELEAKTSTEEKKEEVKEEKPKKKRATKKTTEEKKEEKTVAELEAEFKGE